MKTSDVDRFLVRKLRFTLCERRKHDDYQVRLDTGAVPLPTLLTLSRSSGEVSKRNLNGLANNLGMSAAGFRKGGECNIGRTCVLSCLVGYLFTVAIERALALTMDGEFIERMCESATLILAEAEGTANPSPQWNRHEVKELKRAIRQTVAAWDGVNGDGRATRSASILSGAMDHWRLWVESGFEAE